MAQGWLMGRDGGTHGAANSATALNKRLPASVGLLLLLGVVLLQEGAQELDGVGGPLAVQLHHALHQHGHHCKDRQQGVCLIRSAPGRHSKLFACGAGLQSSRHRSLKLAPLSSSERGGSPLRCTSTDVHRDNSSFHSAHCTPVCSRYARTGRRGSDAVAAGEGAAAAAAAAAPGSAAGADGAAGASAAAAGAAGCSAAGAAASCPAGASAVCWAGCSGAGAGAAGSASAIWVVLQTSYGADRAAVMRGGRLQGCSAAFGRGPVGTLRDGSPEAGLPTIWVSATACVLRWRPLIQGCRAWRGLHGPGQA